LGEFAPNRSAGAASIMTAHGSKFPFELRPQTGGWTLLFDGRNLQALTFGVAVIAVVGGGLWSALTLLF